MNRLAALLVAAICDKWMDITARVRILEGFARKPPGTWSRRNPLGSLDDIRAMFPDIHPFWVAKVDTGMCKAILMGARSVHGLSAEDADEIVSGAIAGLTVSEEMGDAGGWLYEVGTFLRTNNIPLSDEASLKRARGSLRDHGASRALDVMRKRKREVSLTQENDEGGESVRDVPAVDERSQTRFIIDLLQGPRGGAVYKAIQEEVRRRLSRAPGALEIFNAMIENPDATDVEIARILGKPEWIQLGAATRVSKIRRQVTQMIGEIVRENTRIRSQLDLSEELEGLGFSGRQAAIRAAANLARFLARSV